MKRVLCQGMVLLMAAGVAVTAFAVSGEKAAEEAGAGVGAENAEKALAEATGFFQDANEASLSDPSKASELYAAAALKFEYVLEEKGIRNGKLHANLANTYFLAGDMGRAILHYRRALRYLPGTRELEESLEHARTQTVDVFSFSQAGQLRRAAFFWHYHLSQRTRLILFGTAYAGLWVLAGWKLFEPGRRLAVPGRILATVCLLAGISAVIHAAADYRDRDGVVIAPEIVPRKGDSYIYEPALMNALHGGAEFTLIERRGEWIHARFGNDEEAWLPVESVAFVDGKEEGAQSM